MVLLDMVIYGVIIWWSMVLLDMVVYGVMVIFGVIRYGDLWCY